MYLMKMKKCELRDLLIEMGLSVGGRKADLVKRLKSCHPLPTAPTSCSSCDEMGKRITFRGNAEGPYIRIGVNWIDS
jgi:hypothetical protein